MQKNLLHHMQSSFGLGGANAPLHLPGYATEKEIQKCTLLAHAIIIL